jgi:branched-chain amino acid transport system permease protein
MSAISGIAAYTSAILSIELGLNPWLTILIGIAFSTAVGSLLSYVSVSRGLGVIFVAIVTLAFTLIFENTILGLRSITMGETGLVVPTLWWPLEGLFGRRLASYYVILAYSAIVALIYFMLIHSKFGMALKAIRSDNVSAEVIGIDVTKHQVMAVALGSSILGMGGSLYAYYQGMASPGVFSPLMDITIFLMLILGGFGAPIGPIVGAVFIILIQELTRGLGQLTMTFFGGLLVVLILIFREGIASIFDKVATYVYYSKRS